MKIPAWLVLLGVSTVLVATGIFFARQDLGRADEYASVASFFLALVGAAVSIMSRRRTKAPISGPAEPRSNVRERRWTWIIGSKVVQTGKGSVANVVVNPPGKSRRK